MLTNTSSIAAKLRTAFLLPLAISGFICVPLICFAQEKAEKKNEIFKRVDVMPNPGYELNAYLIKNLKYPEIARKNKVEGKVMVRFIVDEQGRITDPEVTRGVGSGCDEEALRVIKNMPPWKPAMNKGKPVKVYYVLPIKFSLS